MFGNAPDRLGRSSFTSSLELLQAAVSFTNSRERCVVRSESRQAATVVAEVMCMTEMTVWRCEQWVGGSIKEQSLFQSEEAAGSLCARWQGSLPTWSSRSSRCRSSMCGTERRHADKAGHNLVRRGIQTGSPQKFAALGCRVARERERVKETKARIGRWG